VDPWENRTEVTLSPRLRCTLQQCCVRESERVCVMCLSWCLWLLAVSSAQTSSAMFFKYNTSLGPPFHIIVDTNFINFAIKNKLDVVRSMMDCLLAKCTCASGAVHEAGRGKEGRGTGVGAPRAPKWVCPVPRAPPPPPRGGYVLESLAPFPACRHCFLPSIPLTHTHTHTHHVGAGIPCITDCVMAELEKLGPKYRIALRLAKDPRFQRIPCSHKGTYADDCIVNRITEVRACVSGWRCSTWCECVCGQPALPRCLLCLVPTSPAPVPSACA
jgi:rRNA-processing protein FCF1